MLHYPAAVLLFLGLFLSRTQRFVLADNFGSGFDNIWYLVQSMMISILGTLRERAG